MDNKFIERKLMKQIENYPDYSITKDGRIWSEKRERWLKPILGSHGYLYIVLYKNRKDHIKLIHRLVLETFVGPCPKGMEACHNNGIRTDNRLENLRWDTRSNNAYDAVKHGTCNLLGNKIKRANGEKHCCAKLTEQDIRMIIYMCKTGEFTQKEIANIYNIHPSNITHIVTGKNWKCVWKEN